MPEDNYGKMRTCAYYPVNIVDFDENGCIIDEGIESGFEDDFMSKICYTGKVNNEDNDNYQLEIPEAVELNRENIYARLKEIASKINREV